MSSPEPRPVLEHLRLTMVSPIARSPYSQSFIVKRDDGRNGILRLVHQSTVRHAEAFFHEASGVSRLARPSDLGTVANLGYVLYLDVTPITDAATGDIAGRTEMYAALVATLDQLHQLGWVHGGIAIDAIWEDRPGGRWVLGAGDEAIRIASPTHRATEGSGVATAAADKAGLIHVAKAVGLSVVLLAAHSKREGHTSPPTAVSADYRGPGGPTLATIGLLDAAVESRTPFAIMLRGEIGGTPRSVKLVHATTVEHARAIYSSLRTPAGASVPVDSGVAFGVGFLVFPRYPATLADWQLADGTPAQLAAILDPVARCLENLAGNGLAHGAIQPDCIALDADHRHATLWGIDEAIPDGGPAHRGSPRFLPDRAITLGRSHAWADSYALARSVRAVVEGQLDGAKAAQIWAGVLDGLDRNFLDRPTTTRKPTEVVDYLADQRSRVLTPGAPPSLRRPAAPKPVRPRAMPPPTGETVALVAAARSLTPLANVGVLDHAPMLSTVDAFLPDISDPKRAAIWRSKPFLIVLVIAVLCLIGAVVALVLKA